MKKIYRVSWECVCRGLWPGEPKRVGASGDGFLCFNPGVGPKLVFRMSRVRDQDNLAIGHHPQEGWETTQGWQVTTVSDAGTQEREQRSWKERLG